VQAIMAAALLHDVGKLAVPEHILNKPGRLTGPEFEVMKRHAPAGAEILSVVGFPYPVVPIVRHHHESWDGTGYPDGISGEDIPIGARILSVVDCYDALTSHRPYRPRLEDSAALQIIVERRGTMYDPRVVDAFVKMHEEEHEAGGSRADALMESPLGGVTPAAALSSPVTDAALQNLQVVHDLARALAARSPGDEIGPAIWAHVQSRLPATTFVLFRYEEAGDALATAYAAGDEAARFHGSRMPLGERLSGWVAATRQPVVNSDARLDLEESVREGSALRSALAVPIESNGRIAGVLSFYAPAANAFGDDHVRLAAAAAYAVAQLESITVRPPTTSRP
jgi:putative nucleotidyltransferase with HDIG domain